jgi:arylsulfatase A-like enzyme
MRRAATAGLLGLVLGISTSCSETPPPDLVLVVVDTLRADHLGAYGYARPTSPGLDALARSGTLFWNAASPSSWTKPAVASLFTSRSPSEHGAVSFDRDLGNELPTLAEALRARGYYTLGVSGNFVHVSEAHGFARGFDRFESPSVAARGESDYLLEHRPGAGRGVRLRAADARELNRLAAGLLRDRPARPLFLYVHYMDPHAGYEPPERLARAFSRDAAFAAGAPEASAAYVSRLVSARAPVEPRELARLVDLYDAEVAATDEAISELRGLLAAAGVPSALWVVTADHGEEFAEHGSFFHGVHLHDEAVRVPLVFAGPGVPAAVRDEAVDLLDVAPTLLARAGATALADARGRDLFAPQLPARDLVAELHADPTAEAHLLPRLHRFSVTRWPNRLFARRDGLRELYRKDLDPTEQAPVQQPDPSLVGALEAVGTRAWRPLGEDARALDAATRDALRALGYTD